MFKGQSVSSNGLVGGETCHIFNNKVECSVDGLLYKFVGAAQILAKLLTLKVWSTDPA